MMLRFFVPLTRPPPRSTLFPYTRSSDLTPKGVSLMAVNDSLTALMALVDGADSAPSEESFAAFHRVCQGWKEDRKSTRLNSSHLGISYAVFCLKKKKQSTNKK